MRNADLYAGYAVVIEATSPEEIGNGLVFKVGVGQNAVERSSLRQVVDVTETVLFEVGRAVVGPVISAICRRNATDVFELDVVEGRFQCTGTQLVVQADNPAVHRGGNAIDQ